MANFTYASAWQATSGFGPLSGFDTPCGGVASGGVVPNPGVSAVTIEVDLGSAMLVNSVQVLAWYAGSGVNFSYATSSDGVTWSAYSSSTAIFVSHGGSFSSSTLTSGIAGGTWRFWRFSFEELPAGGYSTSLLTINQMQLFDSGTPLITGIGGSCPYCVTGGMLTVSGHYTRYSEFGSAGSIPHENCPVTLWYKSCTSPVATPCAHNPNNAAGLLPGSQICIDGQIGMLQTTTDCNGFYSFSISGCITAFGVGLGNFALNPAYTGCQDSWVPEGVTPQWILDPNDGLPSSVAFGCNASTNWKMTDPASVVTTGNNPPGGGISSAAWEFAQTGTDQGPCVGTGGVTGPCYACNYGGFDVVAVQNGPVYNMSLQQWQADPITGSYTVDMWSPSPMTPTCYYIKDGKYYTVTGVGLVVSDACGNTDMTYGGSGVAATDWYNWVSGSVSLQNWTPGTCSPPLYTRFLGPDGVHDLEVEGPFDELNYGTVQIYPAPFTMTGQCLMGGLAFGVEVQPPCTGNQPERLQADMLKDVLAVAWVDSSGGSLQTAVHRGPSKQIGSSTVGWEATDTVESTGADDIGMVFLPDESLYLTYLLSGSPVYRLNKSLGANGAWLAAGTPNPSVARHSASGRGEGQAFRFRALGTQIANGALQFSQCRDNRGSQWTVPVTVSGNAQGPWCGGVFVDNAYICLFSLAASVGGLAAAGSICLARSVDGGQTWALSFAGFSGQVGSIARTRQGVLVASVLSNVEVGSTGTYPVGWLISHNNGLGWSESSGAVIAMPALALPPVVVAQEDIVYCVWITGDAPQFTASRDGGNSWY